MAPCKKNYKIVRYWLEVGSTAQGLAGPQPAGGKQLFHAEELWKSVFCHCTALLEITME